MNSKYKSVKLTEVLQFLDGKEENNKPFLFINPSRNLDTFFTYKGNMKEISQSENMLTGALKSIFALSENYPDLKANANFMELQRELRDTEDKIQAARRFYNGNVLALNTKIEMFPSNIVASMFHFEKREFFELAEGENAARQPVKVQF